MINDVQCKFGVNASTGAVMVPKGTAAGTYPVVVRVTAAGNGTYNAGSIATTCVARVTLPELRELAPNAGACDVGHPNEPAFALYDVVRATGRKFVFVIDEWDAPYRLVQEDKATRDAYAEWLRSLFKSAILTAEVVVGAYIMGIRGPLRYSFQLTYTARMCCWGNSFPS